MHGCHAAVDLHMRFDCCGLGGSGAWRAGRPRLLTLKCRGEWALLPLVKSNRNALRAVLRVLRMRSMVWATIVSHRGQSSLFAIGFGWPSSFDLFDRCCLAGVACWVLGLHHRLAENFKTSLLNPCCGFWYRAPMRVSCSGNAILLAVHGRKRVISLFCRCRRCWNGLDKLQMTYYERDRRDG